MKNKSLLAVVASHFVVDYTGQVTAMMYPILVITLGLTYTNVGLAAALYMAVSGVAQPIFGYLGDRIGPRYLIAAGIMLHGTFIALVSQAWSFPSLLIVLAVAAVGSGMYHPLAIGIASRSARRLKGTAMGAFFIGGNAGFAVSPVISAIALKAMGLDYALILIAPAALSATLFLFLTRHSNRPAAEAIPPRPPTSPGAARNGGLIFGVSALVAVMLLRGLAFGGLTVFIPLFYGAAGLPVEAAGLALSFFLGGVASGTFLGGFLADRIGKKFVVVVTLIAATPFVLLVASQPGSVPTLIATIVAGLTLGASQTPTVMAVQEYMPRLLGAASGLALGFTFFSQAAGQVLTGVLADVLGLGTAMSLLALAPALAVVAGLLLPGSLRAKGATQG
jgi:FSR family fosmidomycin resistance protein-like MFS transporter